MVTLARMQAEVRASSSRNQELLRTLAETEHAKPSLEQQQRYIVDLQTGIQENAAIISRLKGRVAMDRYKHTQYRDSIMHRFGSKITGKKEQFDREAAEAEHKYLEDKQNYDHAVQTKDELTNLVAVARSTLTDLERDVASHATAQQELDELYDSIFEGRTEMFPEEDDKERDVDIAMRHFHKASVRAEDVQQAVNLLLQAQVEMGEAIKLMRDSVSYSHADMFGGSSSVEVMKRNALQHCDLKLSSVRMLVSQARRTAPDVKPLPNVTVAHGSVMSDVFFDCIFTDMAFNDKIRASQRQLKKCSEFLNNEVALAKERYGPLADEQRARAAKLETARAALQSAREEIFEQLASGAAKETVDPPACSVA